MRPTEPIHLVSHFIRSKTDGDEHFISASQLANLYHLKRNEWIICPDKYYPGVCRSNALHLFPREDGKYINPYKE